MAKSVYVRIVISKSGSWSPQHTQYEQFKIPVTVWQRLQKEARKLKISPEDLFVQCVKDGWQDMLDQYDI